MAAMTQVLLSSDEVKQCILQVDDLKKFKDINLMGKKLGLRKFKKSDNKSLARQMIVEKLKELQSQLSEFPSPPSTQDSDDEIEQEDNLVVQVEEPREEMTVPAVEEMTVPAVEEKPELVDVEKEEEKYDTNKMYEMINEIVDKLKTNEDRMKNTNQELEEKTKKQGETIQNLNDEFDKLFKKYDNACSEKEKLQKSNDKLKLAVRNLMGDL